MDTSKTFETEGASLLAQSDGCAVWQFRNATGDGTMTTYDVFPGVMLCFNDSIWNAITAALSPTAAYSRSTIAARGGWNTSPETA